MYRTYSHVHSSMYKLKSTQPNIVHLDSNRRKYFCSCGACSPSGHPREICREVQCESPQRLSPLVTNIICFLSTLSPCLTQVQTFYLGVFVFMAFPLVFAFSIQGLQLSLSFKQTEYLLPVSRRVCVSEHNTVPSREPQSADFAK